VHYYYTLYAIARNPVILSSKLTRWLRLRAESEGVGMDAHSTVITVCLGGDGGEEGPGKKAWKQHFSYIAGNWHVYKPGLCPVYEVAWGNIQT
jgi:hypothetical protein